VLAFLGGVVDAVTAEPFLAVGVVQAAMLLSATLMLLFPTYAYGQNVAYTEGLVGLAVALVLVTVANLLGFLPDGTMASLVPMLGWDALVWMTVVNLLASTSATVGVYFFAREFVGATDGSGALRTPPADDDADTEPVGFEAAPDDAGGASGGDDRVDE
jgi:hypothetical protein